MTKSSNMLISKNLQTSDNQTGRTWPRRKQMLVLDTENFSWKPEQREKFDWIDSLGEISNGAIPFFDRIQWILRQRAEPSWWRLWLALPSQKKHMLSALAEMWMPLRAAWTEPSLTVRATFTLSSVRGTEPLRVYAIVNVNILISNHLTVVFSIVRVSELW